MRETKRTGDRYIKKVREKEIGRYIKWESERDKEIGRKIDRESERDKRTGDR